MALLYDGCQCPVGNSIEQHTCAEGCFILVCRTCGEFDHFWLSKQECAGRCRRRKRYPVGMQPRRPAPTKKSRRRPSRR